MLLTLTVKVFMYDHYYWQNTHYVWTNQFHWYIYIKKNLCIAHVNLSMQTKSGIIEKPYETKPVD